jgi:hypothetical protein
LPEEDRASVPELYRDRDSDHERGEHWEQSGRNNPVEEVLPMKSGRIDGR